MTTAFSPGHVTCFFQPVRTDNVLTTGSRGVGFKLSLGATVTLEERADKKIEITMDGSRSKCPITEHVLRNMCPDRGFDVTIRNDIPVGQGFGMSAAGALATAISASEISGIPKSKALEQAHVSEVVNNGGLGDVAAILCESHVPLRKIPGANGVTVDTGLEADMNLVVLGDTLDTKSILTDPKKSRTIEEKGNEAIKEFEKRMDMDSLFEISRGFSSSVGLETFEISSFLSLFKNSGMCMLGHSVFTTASKDEIEDLIGTDNTLFSCHTTNELPRIIRKA